MRRLTDGSHLTPERDPEQPSTQSQVESTWQRSTVMMLRPMLFAGAAWALKRELQDVRGVELARHLLSYGARHLALALACTVGSFLALGVIERLALRYAGLSRTVPRHVAVMTAFVTHAFSQSLGLALFTGAAVRLRAYSRYTLDAIAAARISAFVTLTVTLGLLATGAGALLASSTPLGIAHTSIPVRPAGLVLALSVIAYLAWSVFGRRETVGRGRWRIDRPSSLLASGQIAASVVDWLLTGTVLFAFVPASVGVGYAELLRAFLIGQTVGVASHIPGGAGVFEIVVLGLVATADAEGRAALVASLVMFRVVYYLLPLIAAAFVAVIAEIMASRGAPAAWPSPERYPAPSGHVR
jgi:phosphatidylglycerol lysyltransferase